MLNVQCWVRTLIRHSAFSITFSIQHSAFVIQHFFLMGGTGFEPVTAGV
jgi:hypothetical protein